MLPLTLPIYIYKRKRYRIVAWCWIFYIGLTLIFTTELNLILTDKILLLIYTGGLMIWFTILYWLAKNIIQPKPCMELTEKGILFRDYTQPQGKFFAWQEIHRPLII